MELKYSLLALSILAPASALADDGFFKDRQIRLIVGSASGSGYDLNARVLARHWTNYISGAPHIVVQNLPGAGSVTMANQIYNTAPKDGSTIGAAINGMPTAALFTPDVVQYDPRKFIWIGSTNRETHISYVWHTGPVKTLADLANTELVVGATSPGTTNYDYPIVTAKLLGLKFKVVSGYKSITDVHLAMERGEVQGIGANSWFTLKALDQSWLQEKKIIPLAHFSVEPHPDLPGVPTIFAAAKSEADRQAISLVTGRLEYGRPFFLPPGVQSGRVEILRKSFEAAVKDPKFLAEAEKAKIDVDPLSGDKVAELVDRAMQTPKDVVARVRDALAAGDK